VAHDGSRSSEEPACADAHAELRATVSPATHSAIVVSSLTSLRRDDTELLHQVEQRRDIKLKHCPSAEVNLPQRLSIPSVEE